MFPFTSSTKNILLEILKNVIAIKAEGRVTYLQIRENSQLLEAMRDNYDLFRQDFENEFFFGPGEPGGNISEIEIGEQQPEGITIQYTLKIKGKIMSLSMKDTQQAKGKLSFTDKKGSPTDVADGAVTVTSSDESVATVTYDDANNEITVVAGNAGVAALSIKAADTNGNDIAFDDTAIEILPGEASAGTVAFDAPTEQGVV